MTQLTTPDRLAVLERSGLFTRWQDPNSGAVSFVLTAQVAPIQLSFYFVNSGFDISGRYLWFYCAFPPSGSANQGRLLGVADLDSGELRTFPETQFLDASPLVDPATAEVYWVSGLEVWKRGPEAQDRAERVNELPEETARGRLPHRLATHLTFSADKQSLNFDYQIGNEWAVGKLPLDGSPPQVWQQFDRCYNHGQFSPTDPEVQLIAQDWWVDPATGERGGIDNRLWLIRRGEQARPIFQNGSASQTHEWWDPDGQHVWFVDYYAGTAKVDVLTGERTRVWGSGNCHSHASRDGCLLVGDIGTYSWKDGCRVACFNVTTSQEVNIVSSLPEPQGGRRRFHIDPHPRFCLNDQLVCYTTTVLGFPTLALIGTEQLLAATT